MHWKSQFISVASDNGDGEYSSSISTLIQLRISVHLSALVYFQHFKLICELQQYCVILTFVLCGHG